MADGATVVVSDVHLTAADPAGIERFVGFLDGPAKEASRLVIAGDLFDFWVTPAQVHDAALAPVFERLRSLARRADVGFVEGNRDFAAESPLRALGVRRLDDTILVAAGEFRVAVTHGDLLCRRDTRYQAYRRFARSETVRQVLCRLPEGAARRVGGAARRGSAMETASKAYGDMGLDPAAVASMLRAHDADALVCGHVHWGRRHRIDVDGRARDVVVLGAWEDAPSYAEIGAAGVAFRAFA